MPELELRGARFHVQRLGSGEPRTVFLHGLLWDNLSSWYFTVAAAAAGVGEVLLYDLRGHGLSECTASGYRVEEMVDDLAALLIAVGWHEGPVHLVGNSYGGLLAIAFAAAHPEQVASLVLVDSNLSDGSFGQEMLDILRLGGRERDRLITESFRQWAGRHGDVASTRLARTARRLVDETTLAADLEASPALTDAQLARIVCPTLALYGQNSNLRRRGERLARVLPNCTLHLFAGCSHVVLWEATTEVRKKIVGWLEQRRPDRRGEHGR